MFNMSNLYEKIWNSKSGKENGDFTLDKLVKSHFANDIEQF